MPDPRNQFYRLVRSPSGPWVKGSRWATPWDTVNCCAAEGAVALEVQSDGRIKVGPPTVRANQDDFEWGIGLDDVRTAHQRIARAKGITIPTLILPENFGWASVINAVREGRHVMVQGDHGYLPLSQRCQDSYTGDHAFGIDKWRSSDSRILKFDSLCTNPEWVTQAGLRQAAEALALRLRGSRYKLFVALTKARVQLFPVTLYPGAVQDGRGSFVVTESGHALRNKPSTASAAIISGVGMPAGTTFRAAQSFKTGPKIEGNPEWKGTADGRKWFPEAWLRYVGPYTNRETIR